MFKSLHQHISQRAVRTSLKKQLILYFYILIMSGFKHFICQYHLPTTFANSLDSYQAQQNIEPHLNLNYFTL